MTEKLFQMNEYFAEAFSQVLLPWYFSIFFHKTRGLGRRTAEDIMKYVQETIPHHAPEKQNNVPQDILSAFLQTGKYTEKEVIATIFTLMPDATYTSSLMTMWVLLYLTNHPECQEDIHKEIQQVCGDTIDLSMRSRMPVTESFIMEVN